MSDLLSWRVLAHQLDKGEIARIEPVIFKSLKKLCTSCESREECELGLADDFADVAWDAYCANAASLKAFAGMALVQTSDQHQPHCREHDQHPCKTIADDLDHGAAA